MPGLFETLALKGLALRNRLGVSPMCQYSAEDGFVTDWHRVHYASLARGGAGLVVVEATAVTPEGRITPGCLGIWDEARAQALAPVAASIRAYGAIPGIQIAHAGRKASANRPWEGDDHLAEGDARAWQPIASTAEPEGGKLPRVPRAMSLADIEAAISAFVQAAIRAREAGFDYLNLHFAHGYLVQSFLSPYANKRIDAYGGSFENRCRFPLRVFRAVRAVWPEHLALTVRLGAIDFDGRDEETLEESIALIGQMRDGGLDLVDVSMRFTAPNAEIPWGPHFMLPYAARIRRATRVPTAVSWGITDAAEADTMVREDQVDLVLLARKMLENPHFPFVAACELGIERPAVGMLPPQYAHWLQRYRIA
jgi:2,4-dienoyl-CoA reductase-like NADH-dependent reductase (Old Yellow Enzyme family)